MDFNITVKRKFTINGKEYNSIEEMPDDIRETFKKIMGSRADSGRQIKPAALRTKIVFNGTEYESTEAMPQEVRQLYETALRAAGTGTAPPAVRRVKFSIGLGKEPGNLETPPLDGMPSPTKFELSFSVRTLIVTVILGVLLFLLYNFWNSR